MDYLPRVITASQYQLGDHEPRKVAISYADTENWWGCRVDVDLAESEVVKDCEKVVGELLRGESPAKDCSDIEIHVPDDNWGVDLQNAIFKFKRIPKYHELLVVNH